MERSDERLSTRDIASPGGAETAATDTDTRTAERDAALADSPPADSAAVPPERADREYDDGGGGAVAASRMEPVGDGDVVTDEPVEGREPSRESIAAPAEGAGPTRDTGAGDTSAAGTAAAAAGAGDAATRAGNGARDTGRDRTTNGDAAPLLADAGGFQSRWEEIQVRFVD